MNQQPVLIFGMIMVAIDQLVPVGVSGAVIADFMDNPTQYLIAVGQGEFEAEVQICKVVFPISTGG